MFYRDGTQHQALSLNLTGYVRNLADGRVEIEACGEVAELDELQQWLWKGPVMSKVSAIQIQNIPIMDYSKFSIV